jgi:F0F1-type ATP synthase assembly protein I
MFSPKDKTPTGDWYGFESSKPTVTLADSRRLSNAAWSVSSRLIAGLLLYSGLGWLLSVWVGYRSQLIAVGAITGITLATFLVVRGLNDEGDHERES